MGLSEGLALSATGVARVTESGVEAPAPTEPKFHELEPDRRLAAICPALESCRLTLAFRTIVLCRKHDNWCPVVQRHADHPARTRNCCCGSPCRLGRCRSSGGIATRQSWRRADLCLPWNHHGWPL